ncbi:hypothetical protein [Arthrobacter sp. B3I4]|uniref:hypothetical protein n=1 Tax=Arthrobacter sp. B3I4 TaxID=3042267 RepID=UPI002780BEAF|nr:hypothetical protein [Arthrobacter sp. B3I4]MDQ0756101.1 hypothetical protein [Arthrobacter sp. B3I4]
MTTTPATTRQPVPELEAAKLYRQVRIAKVASERADADASRAASEAQEARTRLASVEAEYRAAKLGCVA